MFLQLLSSRPALGAVLVMASALSTAAPAQTDGPVGEGPDEPGALIAQAFDYAYPLVAMGRLRAASLGAGTEALPSPTWQHRRALAGPESRQVTTPNVDTLYSLLGWTCVRAPGPCLCPTWPGDTTRWPSSTWWAITLRCWGGG